MHRPLLLFALLLLLPLMTIAHAAAPAQTAGAAPLGLSAAPTLTVNSLDDVAAGGDLANGVCETAPGNGVCTLRAAIMKANHYPGGGVTIMVPAGRYYLYIIASGGDTEETGDLNLNAAMTIVGAGANATIIDAVTLFNRIVHNTAAVELTGLALVHGRRSGESGAVFNDAGTLTLRNSRVGDSLALGISGNDLFNAGGIFNTGTLAVIGSSIDHNRGGFAGAILNNTAAATTTIVNSTISDNLGAESGGMQNFNGTMSLLFSTVAGNVCTTCSACNSSGGILSNSSYSHMQIKASLVYGNFSCGNSDFEGLFFSDGYNVRGNGGSWVTNASDQFSDPLLQSPGANGGPTPTRALLTGSAAIDAIPPADCTDFNSSAVSTDQRGATRPTGAGCDIGAFEGAVPAGYFGRNLLRNGDAEAAAGDRLEVVPVAYWVPSTAPPPPLPTVVPYCPGNLTFTPECPSSSLALDSPGPVNRGATFFAGGSATDSYASQVIDLTAIAAEIAAGHVGFELAGYLGGLGSEGDYAEIMLEARNGSSSVVQSAAIGPVTAADRGNVTGLLRRRATAVLNTATQSLKLTLHFHAASGNNDGYADNVSLVLSDPPGPLFADGFEDNAAL